MTARGLASGLARQLASQLAGSGGGGAAALYDADAADYFSRAEALGGSFDLTAISGTYTESYVKTAISDYVAGCKTDGIWSKLTEVYLLSGVTFGGLMAKLKHAGTAAMTNVGPFVTGDYAAAGSGTGLAGDGITKYLNSNLLDSSLSADDKSLGAYISVRATVQGEYIGVRTTAVDLWGLHQLSSTALSARWPLSTATVTVEGTNANGFAIVSRRGVDDVEGYFNGVSIITDTATTPATGVSYSYYLFARNTEGTASLFSQAKMSFAFLGSGLTDTDAANLSTRVNALMAAIGANVY
jgi:hypothetical protein